MLICVHYTTIVEKESFFQLKKTLTMTLPKVVLQSLYYFNFRDNTET